MNEEARVEYIYTRRVSSVQQCDRSRAAVLVWCIGHHHGMGVPDHFTDASVGTTEEAFGPRCCRQQSPLGLHERNSLCDIDV